MRPLLLTLILVPPVSLAAQEGRPAADADSVPATVALAEQMGARHPRPLATDVMQSLEGDPWIGTAERVCITVSDNIVRSGEFVVGGFAGYWQGYPKIWWTPASVPSGATLGTRLSLTVHAVRLDSAGLAYIFERPRLAQSLPESAAVKPVLFYPSSFRLPSRGRWMLIARAARNWGCFLYTF